jgi:phosphinothricin acetyltransferase
MLPRWTGPLRLRSAERRTLHEAFGFERAGLLKGVGFKYGRWTDTLLMLRALGPGDAAPPGNYDGTPIPQG